MSPFRGTSSVGGAVGRLAAVLLLLAGVPAALGAQAPVMRFERFSHEQGLSQSIVTCILQDSVGLLWIGTQDGLNRYDGYGVEVYRNDPADPESLGADWAQSLVEDPSGDLWIGTEGGGLSRWQRSTGTFLNYRHDPEDPESLSGNRVLVITRDRGGILWLGTVESGLSRFDGVAADPAAATFERFRHDPADPASLSDDRMTAVYEDRQGNLWVGTRGGLNRFDPVRKSFVRFRHEPGNPRSLSDDRVRAILEDRTGVLWIGTHQGLNRFDPVAGGFVRYLHDPADSTSLSHDWVRAVYEDRDGRLWVGTDGGLNLWQPESGSFVSYRHDPADPTSLGSDQIVAIAQDRGGVLWIGTIGGGLSKWNPSTWAFVHHHVEAPGTDGGSDNVFAISEDREGSLWLGTFGGGLVRLDRATGERTRYTHDPRDERSLADDRVTALLHDRGGVLWIGTVSGGLNRFDAASGTFTSYRHDPERPETLSADAVAALFEDRAGALWVGTHGGGLNLHRADGTFRRFQNEPEVQSLSNDRAISIAEDADGRLWVATGGGGLNRFDAARGTFLRVRHDPDAVASLSTDELIVVHVDAAARLWVGTKGSGLDRLERLDEASGQAVFTNYSTRQGLPSDTIWGIRSDPRGALWLSTGAGLARLDPRTETFKTYSMNHGLQSNEFNMGAHFRSPSGELFFGGANGVNAFFPDRVRGRAEPPPVVLTGFTKFNEPVSFARPVFDVEEIHLDYRDHFLTFEFAVLDYTAPEQNRYRYRLEGPSFDSGWIERGNQRQLTFPSLDPGEHRLRVQGSDSYGTWNEEGLVLAIEVRPPFWRTWWFRVLALCVLATSGWLVVAMKTRGMRRNNERLQVLVGERTRDLEEAQEQLIRKEKLALLGELAGSVAHELRNPLGAIKNSIFYLDLTQKSMDEKGRQHLDLMEKEVVRSNAIVTELLDYAHGPPHRPSRVVLQEVVEGVLGRFEIPAAVRLERRFAQRPLRVAADPAQITGILENLFTNAVQAMPDGGLLRVECRRRDGEVGIVTVTDTGVGIAAEDLARIFEPLYTTKVWGIGLGLALSQRYAEENRGRIDCESAPGEGSTFRLVLPALPEPTTDMEDDSHAHRTRWSDAPGPRDGLGGTQRGALG